MSKWDRCRITCRIIQLHPRHDLKKEKKTENFFTTCLVWCCKLWWAWPKCYFKELVQDIIHQTRYMLLKVYSQTTVFYPVAWVLVLILHQQDHHHQAQLQVIHHHLKKTTILPYRNYQSRCMFHDTNGDFVVMLSWNGNNSFWSKNTLFVMMHFTP